MDKNFKNMPQFTESGSSRGCQRAIAARMNDEILSAVFDLARRRWVNDEPSPDCLDANESHMERVLAFIESRSTKDLTEEVRSHLVGCARCQFLYTRLREPRAGLKFAVDEPLRSPEECRPPAILSKNLRSSGPVVFPGGEVSDGAWEFGQLCRISESVAEQICEIIATRAWNTLCESLPRQGIVVVCFSAPLHRCGKRIAAKMVEAGHGDVHVVMADDFFAPKLWCDPKELRNRFVLVLVDVVHTGGLLERLLSVCRQGEPKSLVAAAVIEQASDRKRRVPFYALWSEPREQRITYDRNNHQTARFFDPASALARTKANLPPEIADRDAARATIEDRLVQIEPMRKYIEATGALKHDAQIGGVCYPWAIDLLALLGHDEARAQLAARAEKSLRLLAADGAWCIVYPASRHRRAGAWAQLLAGAMGWPVLQVGLRRNTHYGALTRYQRRVLTKYGRALIVDAAIRTGKMLQGIVDVVRASGWPMQKSIAAFYAFDGLYTGSRERLQDSLGITISSLFRLPLGAPTDPVGRYCRKQLGNTLAEIDTQACADQPWLDVVRSYCRKKLESATRARRSAPRPLADGGIREALEEGCRGAEARLEASCHHPRSSLVKHLDVEFALREPRTRNVLHGFLCNSMPPEFIEWCALALATQSDYGWLDRDWLVLHKRLLTNSASDRWQFLACVAYWMSRDGKSEQVDRARHAIQSFCQTYASDAETLFPDVAQPTERVDKVGARCSTLLSVLSTRP